MREQSLGLFDLQRPTIEMIAMPNKILPTTSSIVFGSGTTRKMAQTSGSHLQPVKLITSAGAHVQPLLLRNVGICRKATSLAPRISNSGRHT